MDNKGFTLGELMIVVVIIGILAAIAVPLYSGYSQRARRAEAFHLVQTVAMNEEKYFAEHGTYTDLTNLSNSMHLSALGTLSSGNIVTDDWSIQVLQPATGQFFVRAVPRTDRVGTLRPCMRSDGVQGYNASGDGFNNCAQADWR